MSLVNLDIEKMPKYVVNKMQYFIENYKPYTYTSEEKVVALDEDDDFWK